MRWSTNWIVKSIALVILSTAASSMRRRRHLFHCRLRRPFVSLCVCPSGWWSSAQFYMVIVMFIYLYVFVVSCCWRPTRVMHTNAHHWHLGAAVNSILVYHNQSFAPDQLATRLDTEGSLLSNVASALHVVVVSNLLATILELQHVWTILFPSLRDFHSSFTLSLTLDFDANL